MKKIFLILIILCTFLYVVNVADAFNINFYINKNSQYTNTPLTFDYELHYNETWTDYSNITLYKNGQIIYKVYNKNQSNYLTFNKTNYNNLTTLSPIDRIDYFNNLNVSNMFFYVGADGLSYLKDKYPIIFGWDLTGYYEYNQTFYNKIKLNDNNFYLNNSYSDLLFIKNNKTYTKTLLYTNCSNKSSFYTFVPYREYPNPYINKYNTIKNNYTFNVINISLPQLKNHTFISLKYTTDTDVSINFLAIQQLKNLNLSRTYKRVGDNFSYYIKTPKNSFIYKFNISIIAENLTLKMQNYTYINTTSNTNETFNFTLNLTQYTDNQYLNFSISDTANTSIFNVTYKYNSIYMYGKKSNMTIFSIHVKNNITKYKSYNFTIKYKANKLNIEYIFPVSVYIGEKLPILSYFDSNLIVSSMKNTEMKTFTLTVKNDGNKAKDCYFNFDNTLNSYISSNLFNIPANTIQSAEFTILYPISNIYNEYLKLNCVSDYDGTIVSTLINKQYIIIVTTDTKTDSVGGATPEIQKWDCSLVVPESIDLYTTSKVAKLDIINKEKFTIYPYYKIVNDDNNLIDIVGITKSLLPEQEASLNIIYTGNNSLTSNNTKIIITSEFCKEKSVKINIIKGTSASELINNFLFGKLKTYTLQNGKEFVLYNYYIFIALIFINTGIIMVGLPKLLIEAKLSLILILSIVTTTLFTVYIL